MIILASDHAGYKLKEELKQYFSRHHIEYVDAGANSYDAQDAYPDIAKQGVKLVLKNTHNFGIFICGSGVGMSMVANRHKGIRAVLAYDVLTAEMARRHNNANVLCMGQNRVTKTMAIKIIKAFLSSSFDGGRHQARIDKF